MVACFYAKPLRLSFIILAVKLKLLFRCICWYEEVAGYI